MAPDVSGPCVICGRVYAPDTPGARSQTCSDVCHEQLVDQLVAEFGETKNVRDLVSGRTFVVPTRDIIERGLRWDELSKYPEAGLT